MRGLFMVELMVSDLDASVCWYRDVIGLPVQLHDKPNHFVLLGNETGRVALKQGLPEPGGVKLHFELPNLEAELHRLSVLGVRASGPLKESSEGYRRGLFYDPDGYVNVLFEWMKHSSSSQ